MTPLDALRALLAEPEIQAFGLHGKEHLVDAARAAVAVAGKPLDAGEAPTCPLCGRTMTFRRGTLSGWKVQCVAGENHTLSFYADTQSEALALSAAQRPAPARVVLPEVPDSDDELWLGPVTEKEAEGRRLLRVDRHRGAYLFRAWAQAQLDKAQPAPVALALSEPIEINEMDRMALMKSAASKVTGVADLAFGWEVIEEVLAALARRGEAKETK